MRIPVCVVDKVHNFRALKSDFCVIMGMANGKAMISVGMVHNRTMLLLRRSKCILLCVAPNVHDAKACGAPFHRSTVAPAITPQMRGWLTTLRNIACWMSVEPHKDLHHLQI